MLLNRAIALLALSFVFLLPAVLPIGHALAQSKDAEAPEPPIVGVVDVQRIIRDAAAANSIREALNAAKERFEVDLKSEGEGLKAEEEQLRNQQTILSPEAFAAKRRDLEQRYAELRRRVQESSGRLARARDSAFNTVRTEMYKVLTTLMEEKHITMTLARKNVLVYDERMNITDEVLKRLNARLSTVDVVIDDGQQ